MWRYGLLFIVILSVAFVGFSMLDQSGGDVSASVAVQPLTEDLSSYARADSAWGWQFPRDYGAHPAFQTEWWYYTGNLATDEGRRFGFQFTVFRRAITPSPTTDSESEWRTGQVYMAHFTLTDVAGDAFYHAERYSRGGADLAGAMPINDETPYRVWLEDWQVAALNDDATSLQLHAQSIADNGTPFAVDFTLTQAKPLVLQGNEGLSAKSSAEGNASYYFSFPRLDTAGILSVDGQTFNVMGQTWMDHEFSTSALGADALGWDWFGLIFDDNTELMIGQIRLLDGGREPAFSGLYIHADGTSTYLPASAFTITETDTWTSPHTGAVYPSGWSIRINGDRLGLADDLTFTATPLIRDQELYSGDIAYWEGTVQIEGDKSGYGYAELTGYANQMTGRF